MYCNQTVDILGTKWTMIYDSTKDKEVYKTHNGWCDDSKKECHVGIRPYSENHQEDIGEFYKRIARHEIIHAFAYESGVVSSQELNNGKWAKNESMIDWLAIQSPKIFKVFKELQIL